MLLTPFYDPSKTYEENYQQGPFGAFANGEVIENKGEPKFEIFGHKVYLPLGIPAGPLLNGNFIKAALDKGFDIPMQKTVRSRVRACHPWPNVLPVNIVGDIKLNSAIHPKKNFEEPISITNSFGNPSRDPNFWQEDIRSAVAYAGRGQIVTASFEGTRWEGFSEEDYINDWVLCAKLLKETGVAFIEANLSCPNEGTSSLLCYDISKVEKIVRAIKKEIGDFPLVLKTSYFADEALLHDFVGRFGNIVEGFASINTIQADVVDSEGKQVLPGEGRLKSGICGASVKWAGLEMVKRLKKLREELGYKYTIIGVGGVTTADDFFEYRDAGADVVMSATGTMWNPYLARDIKERLR